MLQLFHIDLRKVNDFPLMDNISRLLVLRLLRGHTGVQHLRHSQTRAVNFFVVYCVAKQAIDICERRKLLVIPALFKYFRTGRLIQIHQSVLDYFEFLFVFIIGDNGVIRIAQRIQTIESRRF